MLYSNNSIKSYNRVILVVVLLLVASFPTILWMYDRWIAVNSYYSHGILVPFVSLFLIWEKQDRLKVIPHESSPWGLRVFIIGAFFYWVSAILHFYFSSAYSMLIIAAGLILHFYGQRIFRELLFPLLFLVFMIPLPLVVVLFVCFKLKIMAAHLATFILNAIGLPAIQQSSLIKMSHSYVLVEDSCGGLRSLISLIALGCVFAYRLRLRLTKKIILFLSAIPIAIITNACRIVFLAAVGELWGTEYTQGALHEISGYMVFVFAFFMLYAVKKFLAKTYV